MWKTVKLGDVCDLQNGFAFKSSDYVDNSNTLNIRMSNIRPNGKFNEFHNIKYLPDDYANKYANYKLIEGDLIIAMTDMAGDPKILGMPTIIKNLDGRIFLLNQRVGKLHSFSDEIYVPYLCYFLSTLKNFFKSKGAGGLQINISKKDILSAEIPLPPLAEQERIVAKLDAAFAEVDKAVEGLSNKLISCESLLVKSISDEFAVPKAEHNIKFADVCELKRGYDLPKRQRKSGNFPLFSANGITDYVYESKVVAPGVVTGRSGTIGAVHYTDEDFWPLNTALYVRDFKGNLPRYIFYFLKSFNLKSFSSGAGVPTLNRNVLSAELVNINRKKEEQQRAINKLDSVINKIEKLKITFKEQENNYIALKSAILSKELQSSEAA